MNESTDKTKYILFNWNQQPSQNEVEFFDMIEDVALYLNNFPMLPEDFTVYEIAKEIKFKLVPT